jgi:hypothetical protein
MSVVDDTKHGDQEQPKKGVIKIGVRPENEGRVEIGFIPYQLESPPHLAGFPRNILFAKGQAADGTYFGHVCYYPDPNSFVEDEETKRMAYYRRESSPYSMMVIFKKKTGGWQTFKYRDGQTVHSSTGRDFKWAMFYTTIGGPEEGEV